MLILTPISQQIRLLTILFLITALNTPTPLSAAITCIIGCSGSGKSSIAKALHKRLGSDASEHLAIDELVLAIGREQLDYHPDENTLWATASNTITERMGGNEKMAAFLQTKMCIKIAKAVDAGKHVIMDMCNISAPYIKFLHVHCAIYPTLMVLVYCPIPKLMEHTNKRNNGPYLEHRDLEAGFEHLDKLFQTHTPNHHAPSCGTVCKLDLCKEYVAILKKYPSDSDTILARLRQLNAHFGLENEQEVSIASCRRYDLIVDTGTHIPEECASTIKEKLDTWSRSRALKLWYDSIPKTRNK